MNDAQKEAPVDVNSTAEEIRQQPLPEVATNGSVGAEPLTWRAPMTRTERWVLASVATLGVLFGVSSARTALDVHNRRAALLEKSAAEASSLQPREAEILDLTRRWMIETATGEAADFAGPVHSRGASLTYLLSQTGLYFRAAAPDVTRPASMPEAVRTSVKDALALCLLSPPTSTEDLDLTVTATRAPPGSPELEEATGRLARLEAVQRGFRVLGAGWAEEVKAADPIGLRMFEAEFAGRTEAELGSARGWSAGSYFVAVVDELPDGMHVPEAGSKLAESMQTSLLPAVQGKPHRVRVAVFDLIAKTPVLRLRARVDASAFSARTGLGLEAATLAEDCALGAQVRKAGEKAELPREARFE